MLARPYFTRLDVQRRLSRNTAQSKLKEEEKTDDQPASWMKPVTSWRGVAILGIVALGWQAGPISTAR